MIWLYWRYSPIFSNPQCRYPTWGMQRTTVSPSSSSTSRSTPCVAGCCGPMLMSMCSPERSGSSVAGGSIVITLPEASVTRGTRAGRPCASRPLVESWTSTVRFWVAMSWLLSRLLPALQALAHVGGQVLERIRDRELLHRVARLGLRGERLAQLLRAAEAAAEREVLPQRIAFLVLLPHEDAAQVRMPLESDAEHVEALALEPVGALPDR